MALEMTLLIDLCFVGEKSSVELGVLWVLFESGDGAPGVTLAADEIREGGTEEVALIWVDGASFGNEELLSEVDHIFVALGLLSNSGKKHLLFSVCHGVS